LAKIAENCDHDIDPWMESSLHACKSYFLQIRIKKVRIAA
jgi:hypothetical protein